MMIYLKYRKVVKDIFYKNKSNVHFSFDLWIFKNHMILIIVINYFIDKNGNPRTILLIIKRI